MNISVLRTRFARHFFLLNATGGRVKQAYVGCCEVDTRLSSEQVKLKKFFLLKFTRIYPKEMAISSHIDSTEAGNNSVRSPKIFAFRNVALYQLASFPIVMSRAPSSRPKATVILLASPVTRHQSFSYFTSTIKEDPLMSLTLFSCGQLKSYRNLLQFLQ